MADIRVRFAPSPTGELHIGGARTALFNYLYARKTGGTFILRIDDTDLERSRTDYIDKLIASLKWLGLEWDEGPYFQSKRLAEYTKEAERLVLENKAYRCYCSMEELAAGREKAKKENRAYLYPGTCRSLTPEQEESLEKEGRKPVIRLLTPDRGKTLVSDEIRGEVSFDNAGVDDFIIMKSNGLPTYNFASVVDDLQMKISHIIRAEEHLSNTPRQILCARALGNELPKFAHVPMILAPDRSKLSKRHGATSVEEFKEQGFLPETLVNYMALLGWSPGGDEELMTLDKMIDNFTLDRVNKTAAIYDTDKLSWMNSQYMKKYDPKLLAETAIPFFEKKNLLTGKAAEADQAKLERIVVAVRERSKTLADLADNASYFLTDDFDYEEKGVKKHFKKEGAAACLRQAAARIDTIPDFEAAALEEAFHRISEELQVPPGRFNPLIRLAVTGRMGGPGLFDIIAILGQQKTIARLEKAANYIDSIT
ncbi:MAG TPA: glutamate--tRNA ligase [Firmicutes bacterium]|nr:glutamate--tRNA ligase [Bacillota bacterium]